MGARPVKSSIACCCTGSEQEGAETIGVSTKPSKDYDTLWEEEQVVTDARLFGHLREVPTKPSAIGREREPLEFVLDGSAGEFGVELVVFREPDPPVLVVAAVQPEGQLARTKAGDPGLCPGDQLVEVCQTGYEVSEPQSVDDMFATLQRLRASPPASVLITARIRSPTFYAKVKRTGSHWRRLGLTIGLRPKEGILLIASVQQAGLVQEWNEKNSNRCICVGDRIVGVNGCSHDAYAIYQLIQATGLGGDLKLRIEPPPRGLAAAAQAWAMQATQPDAEEVLESL